MLSAAREAEQLAAAVEDNSYTWRRIYQPEDGDDDDDDDEEDGISGGDRYDGEPSHGRRAAEASTAASDITLARCIGRVQAQARARRAEHVARETSRPLATQPLEPSLWQPPLRAVEHIEYRSLPKRPEALVGRPLFGWVPEEWAEAYRIARTVCDVCGGGDEAKGNLILLCDGDGCDRALHMGCLDPPLKRMPAKNREWYCPTCRAQNKARGGLPPPEPPSLYEQQRLDNIARNQRILAELGLA